MNGEDLIFNSDSDPISYHDFERTKNMLLADCQKEASCTPTALTALHVLLADGTRQAELKKLYDKKKKKGHAMYDMDGDYNAAQAKNEYLSNRISEVYFDKSCKLQKQYGLVDDARPATLKELVDRIIAGKYVIKDGMADKKSYYPLDQIRWRDPAVKEDPDGFEKASVLLNKARTQTQDIVNIKDDPAERLKALQDFESATIQ